MSNKNDQAISVALSKWMLYVFGSLFVAAVMGIGGAFFVLYTDVATLKDNDEKFKQQRQVSVKQWEKLRRLKDKQAEDMRRIRVNLNDEIEGIHGEIDKVNKYLYTFHGKSILGIKVNETN